MSSATSTSDTQLTRTDRVLNWVERVGNKLPEPFMLFLILFLITGVVSTVMELADVVVEVPGAEEPTVIKGLFTGDGLAWLTTNLGENYIGFPPLLTVMPILLAIGVAQHSGMLAAGVRRAFGSSPKWMLPYVVGFVGVIASVMADSAFVVVPPLAALVFKAAGRHPVAGLLGGFAAAGAGYSTNIIPTSLDALFAGITNSVMETLPGLGATDVNAVSNWWFNIASSLVLGFVAGFIIDRVIEPRLTRQGIPVDEVAVEDGAGGSKDGTDAEQMRAELTPQESRGLLFSLLSAAVLTAVVVVAAVIPGSPWRNEDGGYLPESPLLDSIVFLVFAYFVVMGVVYGVTVGTVKNSRDFVQMMSDALKEMLPFIVLAFILGQFIALFNWSGIGSWIAVTGANGLEGLGLTGFPALVGFIILASFLNLFIISGSGMWTIMAAVFVPMFAIIGYEPSAIQAAFRVGDSATQVITPMNPYMVVLLGMLRKYEPGAGLGSLIARMLPFVIPFWLVWTGILAVFYLVDLPLGPGADFFLGE